MQRALLAEPAARLEMTPMVCSLFISLSTLNSQASLIYFAIIFTILSLAQAANAAWNMGEWDQMSEYVSKLDDGDESKLKVFGNSSECNKNCIQIICNPKKGLKSKEVFGN